MLKVRICLVVVCLAIAQGGGAQQWADVNIVCPCTLTSSDLASAQLEFGLENHLPVISDELRVTVGIVGEFTDPQDSYKSSAFLDTVEAGVSLEPNGQASVSTTINLGSIPNGRFYFELVLHDTNEVLERTIVDSVWFEGEIAIPATSLNLRNIDYLIDTDADGVADANERLLSTDPTDANDVPATPVIDLLILYTAKATANMNVDANLFVTHTVAVTEHMFEDSGSPVVFRPVGILSEDDEDDLVDQDETSFLDALPTSRKFALQEEYQSDITLVFRGESDQICGIAEDIGGLGGRGFIHPADPAVYTEVFLDTLYCGINVTAHEIGHLMGLGHSFAQGSVGTFDWSRGHGVYGRFGSIMTYAQSAYYASDINRFSNPTLDCAGDPCGIHHSKPNAEGSSNSALSLKITSFQVAAIGTPSSTFDVDGDGHAADVDVFPLDSAEWLDSDGDGFGDNGDAFPNDPLEWADTDGDGIGDNSDTDIDNDGVLNGLDPEPFDATIGSVALLSIEGDTPSVQFGSSIEVINDFTGDGTRDLAVSGPLSGQAATDQVGMVYLFSSEAFTRIPNTSVNPNGTLSVASLRTHADTWQIRGLRTTPDQGRSLYFLQHDAGSNPASELLIGGWSTSFLLSLESSDLLALDNADGTADRQIDLRNCAATPNCIEFSEGPNLWVTAVQEIGDFDDDGLKDLGAVGRLLDSADDAFLAITRQGINDVWAARSNSDIPTIREYLEGDPESVVIRIGDTVSDGSLSLRKIGNIHGGPRPELGIGVPGNWQTGGKFYVFSMDQLSEVATLDTDGDRIIDIEDFVRASGTYQVTNPLSSSFGRSIDVLNDVDGDGLVDVLVWGSQNANYILSTVAIRVLDLQDLSLDGRVELTEDIQDSQGVWILNNLEFDVRSIRSVLFSELDGVPDQLVFSSGDRVLTAALEDLDYLDDPSKEDLNGIINIPRRPEADGVYQIRQTVGPMGHASFNGLASLGDLDGDNRLDFTWAVHSKEIDSDNSSIRVMLSSSMPTLDAGDGKTDHILALHNDFTDTDSDGQLNIVDEDDDNDALRDELDKYPVLSDYQYDTDRDGVANALDAFPFQYWYQFDLDEDGIDDYYDNDLDGDGVPNTSDDFPNDTDNDGLANNVDLDDDRDGIADTEDALPLDTDNDGIRNQEDLDDDDDGIPDAEDQYLLDTDNDGIKNDLDEDDDGDGVNDLGDAFPLDSTESADTDGDGVGDVADVFVTDATEWSDFDGDGTGDNADLDDDNDGTPDLQDVYPLDATEWADSDGDGYGDNTDAFPQNHLEWADVDGDGLGDNFGIAGFTSYRFVTPWFEDEGSTLFNTAPEFYIIGDSDGDGESEIAITNAFRKGYEYPIFLISVPDFMRLDLLDRHRNQSVDLSLTHTAVNTWRLINVRRGFHSPRYVASFRSTQRRGGSSPIFVRGPFDFGGSGGVYLITDSQLGPADTLDGSTDGIIDYYRCVQTNTCKAVYSTVENHAFGSSTEFLQNFGGTDETSMLISTYYSQTREGDRDGVAMAYVIPEAAIEQTFATSSNARLELDEVLKQSGTVSIYPEQAALGADQGVAVVHHTTDLTHDGRDDFVISQPNRQRVFIVDAASVSAADADDGTTDGEVDIQRIYRQPGSYKFDGFNYQASQLPNVRPVIQTGDSQPTEYLTLMDSDHSYLVNTSELATLDAADQISDSTIRSISGDVDKQIWKFSQMRSVTVCGSTDLSKPSQILASMHASPNLGYTNNTFKLYVVDEDKLVEMDAADGTADGELSLIRQSSEEIDGQWEIHLGKMHDHTIQDMSFACACDLDKDGVADVAITFRQQRDGEDANYRTVTFLLMSPDLRLIDELDGTRDRKLDLSILWPEAGS